MLELGPTWRGGADPVDVHVGDRIRQIREQSGVSETALAAALGLGVRQLRNYERGANQLSVSRLFRISRFLNVSAGYFFEGLAPANDGVGRPQADP